MTVSIIELWLPILLGGLFAWLGSAIIHMVIKYHNSDYKRLENEDQISLSLKGNNGKVGIYTLPHCADFKEMSTETVQQKYKDGPVAMITVMNNGLPPMGKLLTQQLLFFIVGCLLVAYVASFTLGTGAEGLSIFRLCFVVAFVAFGWGVIPYSIWFGQPWGVTIKYLVDALIYALIVASTFLWFWPA